MRKIHSSASGLRATYCRVLLVLLACLALTSVSHAELTLQQERGKIIYLTGKSPTTDQEITAYFSEEKITLPAETSPCASCHGYDGTGRPESGLFPPNITWQFLTKTYGHLHANGLEHPPFAAETLKVYLSQGLFPGKVAWNNPSMPLYKMAEQDMDDLVAYIQQLGEIRETGISDTKIRIGTLLPGAGLLAAVGQAMNDILQASFSEINSNGGIYGRKLELVTLFVPDNQRVNVQQIESWLAEQQLFALISTFLPNAESELSTVSRTRDIPLIGPFSLFSSATFAENRQIFYIYPGLKEQMQTLLHFVSQKISMDKPRIAVLYPPQDWYEPVLAGIREASRELYWPDPLMITLGNEDTELIVSQLKKASIDLVVFLGDEGQTGLFLQTAADDNWTPYILGSGVLAGKTIIAAPEVFSGRIYLSYPTLPADRKAWGLKELEHLQRKYNLSESHIQARISAYSSAKILIEALRLSGRNVDRNLLTSALVQFNHFDTGLTPLISYSGNNHIGVQGTYVIRYNSARNSKKETTDTEWVELH